MDPVPAAVDRTDLPPRDVGQRVVARTDHDEVVEVGGAAVDPTFLPMVGVGPGCGPVAALDGAEPSLFDQLGETLGGAGVPAAATEVQDPALPIEHRGDDAGGTRHAARDGTRHAEV